MLSKLKKLLKQVRARFPSKLPVGMSEFDAWADSIIDTYTLATKNKDSIKFTLATSVMHLKEKDAFIPKHHFYLILEAAAAKQIAGATFMQIKERAASAEKAAADAESAKPAV
jgi:hypothetical protein